MQDKKPTKPQTKHNKTKHNKTKPHNIKQGKNFTDTFLMGNKWSSRLFVRNVFRCSQSFTALAVKGFKHNIQKDCESKKKL